MARRARVVSKLTSPGLLAESVATARWWRSPRIEAVRRVRTDPGPTSMKTRAPSRCIASTVAAKRTGRIACSPIRAAINAGSVG